MTLPLRGALCTALLAALPLAAPLAHAQSSAPAPAAVVSFDIPAQPLSSALLLFGRQSGQQLAAPSALLAGQRSQPVHGTLPPTQALQQLLAGTGLRATAHANGLRIEAAPAAAPARVPAAGNAQQTTDLDDVQVHAWRADGRYRVTHSGTATRTGSALRDVPQSMQIVSREVIEDQQLVRLTDVLQNVSSVQINGTGGNRGETYQIRGFVTPRYAINGFALTSAMDRPEAFVDLANVEQVEVLKGPASVMFGLGDPGGVINIVTRAPRPEFAADAALQAGSFGFQRAEGSVTGPLNASGTLSARATAAWQEEDGFRDHAASSRRSYGAAALRWDPDADTRIDLAVDHVDQSQPFDRGLIATDDGVYVHDARRYLGETWSVTGARKTVASLVAQRAFSPAFNLRVSGRYSDAHVQDHGAVDLQGVEDDGRTVRRRITDRTEASNDANVRVDAIFDTTLAGMRHRVLAGVEHTRAQMDFASARANIGSLDMWAPQYGVATRPVTRPNADYAYDVEMNSVYLQDQVTLSPHWKALFSLRHDRVRSDQDDFFNEERTRVKDSAVTRRAGLVYQPNDWAALYASYTESFQPQSGQTRDGAALSPERGEQFELGTRLDLLDERLTLTSAVFQITKQDVATEDPFEPDFSILTGEQRVRGWEVDVSGRPAEGWQVIANVSLLDAEITRDNTYAVGNQLVGVPRYSGRLWVQRDFGGVLDGLTVGAGVTRVGEREVDLDNSFRIDGYTTFDARIGYALTPRVDVSLRLRNLTDRFYIEGVQASNNLYAGTPRSAVVQVKVAM